MRADGRRGRQQHGDERSKPLRAGVGEKRAMSAAKKQCRGDGLGQQPRQERPTEMAEAELPHQHWRQYKNVGEEDIRQPAHRPGERLPFCQPRGDFFAVEGFLQSLPDGRLSLARFQRADPAQRAGEQTSG